MDGSVAERGGESSEGRARNGELDVLIVGAGFAGLGAAIKLLEAGVENLAIVEATDDVGGVWRDNTYPGVACDVMSHLYSYSFAPQPSWSRQFAPGREIHEYLRHVVDRFGLRRFIRFSTKIERARWDETNTRWELTANGGEVIRARAVVSGVGTFGRPKLPDVPGLASFDGPVLHSAKWDHSVSLEGKRVAVVGTGASSIQIVPEAAKAAREVVVYQRTPAWIPPKQDRPIGERERALYAAIPAAQKLHRLGIYWQNELLGTTAFLHSARMRRLGEAECQRNMRRHIKDPALREKLTPKYEIGCKRVLPSNLFYPALARPNVSLVAAALDRVEGKTLFGADGSVHEVDVVICATGFDIVDEPVPFELTGRRGADLRKLWATRAEAYLGTTVSGFPNMFLVTGPNTGLGTTSMIFMMESQFAYIADAMKTMRREKLRWVDVRPEAQAEFNAEMQRRAEGTTWLSGCKSWYLNREGKNVGLWPSYTFEYRWRTRRFDLGKYQRAYEAPVFAPREAASRGPAALAPA